MTREEAIRRLKEYAQYSYGIWHNDEEDTKAFDMAIEALSAEVVSLDESCVDCPLYDHDRNNCPRFNRVIPQTIADLSAEDVKMCSTCADRPSCGMSDDCNGKACILYRPKAEAVQGEWKERVASGDFGSHWYEYECSVCGNVQARLTNYCPNCGAKMTKAVRTNEFTGNNTGMD